MEEATSDLPDDPEAALLALANRLQQILDAKRATVLRKLRSVYRGFKETIEPALLERRGEEPALREPRALSGLDVFDTAPIDEQTKGSGGLDAG